jgi:hypothetical protein
MTVVEVVSVRVVLNVVTSIVLHSSAISLIVKLYRADVIGALEAVVLAAVVVDAVVASVVLVGVIVVLVEAAVAVVVLVADAVGVVSADVVVSSVTMYGFI